LIVLVLFFFFNSNLNKDSSESRKIKGITMVAPPNPFPENPMTAIKNTNANWIALIPYAFSRRGKPEVHFQISGGQWWGERPEGIRESIRLAKAAGLYIMLKPQVWMHDEWVGNMDFDSEEEWQLWEKDYKSYILQNVKLAEDLNVDMVCIATEYNIAAIKRASYFKTLIAEIKSIYSGKLTYCASWNDYQNIPFWDVLDYIGISAYFPLTDDATPNHDKLKEAWTPIAVELENFSKKVNKKILFTEFGYLSVDGCAGKSWEIEKQVDQKNINQRAQANAYNALLKSFWDKTWWAGGFVWKWFPNGEGHEGYPDKDYTPQGKEAESVLRKWYEK
jgi:hypothetical protein